MMSQIVQSVRVINPFPDFAIPRIWKWQEEFRHRVADDFAPRTLDEFVADWEAKKAYQTTWGVFRDQELGGVVTYQAISPIIGTAHCLFKRTFWGHETTLVALRMIFGGLFEQNEQLHKLAFWAFRDNSQVLHMVRKLGGDKEGVLLQHTRREGKLVDVMVMGLTREQFASEMPKTAMQEAA